MKKIFNLLLFIALSSVAWAQTPEEIISRMEKEVEKYQNDGVAMTIDAKILMLGTMSTKSYSLGNKVRVEAEVMGVNTITWTDGKTSWYYNGKTNTVEINNINTPQPAKSEGDIGMFTGITDGYDVSIDKETDKEWYILCKKSKTNNEKDAPKKIDLVIAKGSYMPVSLSTKMDGIGVTMRDITFGVTEETVTFNEADFPGVTIEDKRK